jgi:hypothetical protein
MNKRTKLGGDRRERLRLVVTAEGGAKIEFVDEQGRASTVSPVEPVQ